jgi:hypothetical protein
MKITWYLQAVLSFNLSWLILFCLFAITSLYMKAADTHLSLQSRDTDQGHHPLFELRFVRSLCRFSPQICSRQLSRSHSIDILIRGTSRRRGPGSSVGIETGYGLDGPGIESRWGRDFPLTSRPALGPTQPPVQWVLGLSRGVESGRGVTLTLHPLLVPRSKNRVGLYLYSP